MAPRIHLFLDPGTLMPKFLKSDKSFSVDALLPFDTN